MITPQTDAPELAKILGLSSLSFKREDLHPYGSHKGRSIPIMIDLNVAQGVSHFAISSSGNSALAAIRHIQEKNRTENTQLKLSVFIGENINADKKQILIDEIKSPLVTIKETERPLQALTNFIKGKKITSLRQSTDDNALIGYKSLAEEISEATPRADLSAVFIGTSSGSTAQVLAEYFPTHIVQTTAVCPIAQAFAKQKIEQKNGLVFSAESSIADAIVDKVAHRREALVEAIVKSGGSGWIATNKDILEAQRLLRLHTGIIVTPNGALGLAGLIHALSHGVTFKSSVVCIITGK